MAETVYVLTNECMPGLVKIGHTVVGLKNRVTQLNGATGVPCPFECYFAANVNGAEWVERELHRLFAQSRVNPRREFFRLEPEIVVFAIVSIGVDRTHPFHRLKTTSVEPYGSARIETIVGDLSKDDHFQMQQMHAKLAAGYFAAENRAKGYAHAKAAEYHAKQASESRPTEAGTAASAV